MWDTSYYGVGWSGIECGRWGMRWSEDDWVWGTRWGRWWMDLDLLGTGYMLGAAEDVVWAIRYGMGAVDGRVRGD